MIVLLIGNIFMVCILRSHSHWAAWVNYIITCISVFAAAALSNDTQTSGPVIFATLLTIIVYKDIEYNSLTVFKALLSLEFTNREKTTELKQFIGNVAHDLKVRCFGCVLPSH